MGPKSLRKGSPTFAGTYQPILGSLPGKPHTGRVKPTVHTVYPTTTGLPDLRVRFSDERARGRKTNGWKSLTLVCCLVILVCVGFAGVLERLSSGSTYLLAYTYRSVRSQNTTFFQDRPIKHRHNAGDLIEIRVPAWIYSESGQLEVHRSLASIILSLTPGTRLLLQSALLPHTPIQAPSDLRIRQSSSVAQHPRIICITSTATMIGWDTW